MTLPLFAVSLLYESRVAGTLAPEPIRELTIHVVQAVDHEEACVRGTELGARRDESYRNADGDEVTWVFRRVVESQYLPSHALADGIEVSSWLFQGDRLCLNDGWLPPEPGQAG